MIDGIQLSRISAALWLTVDKRAMETAPKVAVHNRMTENATMAFIFTEAFINKDIPMSPCFVMNLANDERLFADIVSAGRQSASITYSANSAPIL